MTDDRRYSEDEVARVFELAASSEAGPAAGAPPSAATHDMRDGGLSLSQVMAIGAEAGFSAESVALAARQVDAPVPVASPMRRLFGMPAGVSHEVTFDSPVSDDEWTRIVVRLRETFDARGKLQVQGPFREWSNGNLHAMLEPTPGGHRLRLRTLKGSAREMLGAGAVMAAFSGMLTVMSFAASKPEALALAGILALTSAAMVVSQAISLPKWARTRSEQMRQLLDASVADRARATALPAAAEQQPSL